VSKGPSHLRVEFENGSIIVLRIRLDPHEKTPMHQVTPRVVVWLTDAYLRDTLASGQTSEILRNAGTTEWVPAQEHSGENLGDSPIEFLAIIPKTKSGGDQHKNSSSGR
jgi:quercetin dioxygenase-like cupin family protein